MMLNRQQRYERRVDRRIKRGVRRADRQQLARMGYSNFGQKIGMNIFPVSMAIGATIGIIRSFINE